MMRPCLRLFERPGGHETQTQHRVRRPTIGTPAGGAATLDTADPVLADVAAAAAPTVVVTAAAAAAVVAPATTAAAPPPRTSPHTCKGV